MNKNEEEEQKWLDWAIELQSLAQALIQESNGKWALPGGWADVYLSVKENVLKEVKEEAGIEANAEMIIALLDVTKNQKKKIPYGITKVFVLCKYVRLGVSKIR